MNGFDIRRYKEGAPFTSASLPVRGYIGCPFFPADGWCMVRLQVEPVGIQYGHRMLIACVSLYPQTLRRHARAHAVVRVAYHKGSVCLRIRGYRTRRFEALVWAALHGERLRSLHLCFVSVLLGVVMFLVGFCEECIQKSGEFVGQSRRGGGGGMSRVFGTAWARSPCS